MGPRLADTLVEKKEKQMVRWMADKKVHLRAAELGLLWADKSD